MVVGGEVERGGVCCHEMCIVRVRGLSGCILLHTRPDRDFCVLAVAGAKRGVVENCEENEEIIKDTKMNLTPLLLIRA